MQCKQCGATCKTRDGRYFCPYCGWEGEPPAVASPDNNVVVRGDGDYGSEVYEKCIGGVLEIRLYVTGGVCSGSGYIINDEGYAITNTHVVTDDNNRPVRKLEISVNGKTMSGTVLAIGDNQGGHGAGVDLALIRIANMPTGVHPVELGDFSKVKNGERVFIIGNSKGMGSCITSGIVSDRLREIDGHTVLMTDCALNPGNSGGPIFNKNGEVIGTVVSYMPDAKGMNFTIPMTLVQEFIRECEKQLGKQLI